MEDVVLVLKDTVNKGAIKYFNEYLRPFPPNATWMICSDYNLWDKDKPNDVATFSVMPYDDYLDKIKRQINELAPKDIKKTRSINPEFIAYLKQSRLFHFSFVLGDRRGITQREGADEKEIIEAILNITISMVSNWISQDDEQKQRYEPVLRKLLYAKSKMATRSPNRKLFRDVALIPLLSSYVAFLLTKHAKAGSVIWLSDRDKIVDEYGALAQDHFQMNHYALCEKEGIDGEATKIGIGVPEQSGAMWYDELVRVPDYIAGTIADYDFAENHSSKSKFINMLEEFQADNRFSVIIRLVLKNGGYQCSRIEVARK